MFISKHSCAFAILSTFVGLAAGATGCSSAPSDDASVSGRGEIINQTKSALRSTDITAINGTYGAGCKNHPSGTDSWSVDPLTQTTLDVPKGNSGCVLTMTGLTAAGADYVGFGSATIDMGASYKGTPTAFQMVGQPYNLAFYGNAMLTPADFSTNFTMNVLISDGVGLGDAGAAPTPGWAVYSGSASASTVPASNYTISFSSFTLTKTSSGVVDSVGGYAQLAEGATPLDGEDYAIVTGSPTSFAAVDAAWRNTSPAPISGGSIGGLVTLRIPALTDSFGLIGSDLTSGQTRTVIVRHTDAVDGGSGVSSYQTFTITFTL